MDEEPHLALLPAEILYEILLSMDMKTVISFTGTNKHYRDISLDDVIWHRRAEYYYNISLLPLRFGTWKDLTVYLLSFQTIGPLGDNIRANYKTTIEEIRAKFLGSKTYSVGKHIYALTQECSYRLEEQKDWERAYLDGIHKVTAYSCETMIHGFVILEHDKQKYIASYADSDCLDSIYQVFPDGYYQYHPRGEGKIRINSKELGVTIMETSLGGISYYYSFRFHDPRIDESTPMKTIMAVLEWGKNDQGLYPNIICREKSTEKE